MSYMSPYAAVIAAALLAGGTGCGIGGPLRPPEVSSREIGPLKFVDGVRARDGGYGARIGDRMVFVFGDTVTRRPGVDGQSWRSSTWCWTNDFEAADGLENLQDPVDANGVPGEFLPFTEEERAYNEAHRGDKCKEDCGARWALWPGPVVPAPDGKGALVLYGKIHARPGEWDFYGVGSSIAVWEDFAKPPRRPVVQPGKPEPALLFQKDESVEMSGALTAGGTLYVFSCNTKGLECPCTLARVPYAGALERGKWRFWAGKGEWTGEPGKAMVVMNGAPMISVHWNRYLKKYLAIYSTPLVNTISIRTAERMEGPWSDAKVVHQGLPPARKENWDYCGLAHPELAKDGGRVEFVTYYRPGELFDGDIRLVELTFAP